jgi:hypothetical protein
MNVRFLVAVISTMALIVLVSVSADAQSGTAVPRTPDGKPDLSGFWDLGPLRFGGDLAQGKESEVPYTPAGLEAFKNRDHKDDPTGFCLPPGIPRMLHSPMPMLVMQTPAYVTMLFEYQRIWRIIYTDGRPHHPDVTDSFMGDSIGKWDGDTLIVETVGLNDRTWLDTAGHQHTADMRVIERIRRTGPETLEYEITIDDPKFYSKPWTHKGVLRPQKATEGLPELLEYFCNENNRDIQHLMSTKPGANP